MDDDGGLEVAKLSSRSDMKANNAVYAGDAVLAKGGNIKGSIWGGGWLADWLAKKLSDNRDAAKGTFDLSERDDFVVAVNQGEGKALYTPSVTRSKGVYLVTPRGSYLDHVGRISSVMAFGEFTEGKGSMGLTELQLEEKRLFNNCPFVLRVTSDSATIRFGIRITTVTVADLRNAKLKIGAWGAVSFEAKRIG